MGNGIIKKAIINGMRTLITTGFPMIYFMYASRILLPDGVGQINFSKSFIAYFTLFAMLGIVHYGTRECTKVRDNRAELSKISQELIIINTFTIIIAMLACFICIFSLERLEHYRVLLVINSFSILFTGIGIEWLYNALEKYTYIMIRTFVFQGAGILCTFVFVKNESDIVKYAIIQLVATYGSNVCNIIYSRNFIDYTRVSNYSIKRHIKPIVIIFLMSLFIQVFTHLDSTMLSLMVNDSATGLYTAATRMNGAIATVIQSLVLVFMPQITYYLKNNEMQKIIDLSDSAINTVLLLSIPAMTGAFFLSDSIIILFSGITFKEAIVTSEILCLRILLVPLNSFFVLYLFIPLCKEKWNLISTGCAAVLNFFINLVLIPRLLHNGAAVSTVGAEAIELILNLYFVSKIMPLKRNFRYLWQYILSSIPICGIKYCIDFTGCNRWIGLIFIIVISACVYFLLLWWMGNVYVKNIISAIKKKASIKVIDS